MPTIEIKEQWIYAISCPGEQQPQDQVVIFANAQALIITNAIEQPGADQGLEIPKRRASPVQMVQADIGPEVD